MLYKPSAHCVAFFTTKEWILYWVKAVHDQYFEPLSENNHYHVSWIDRYSDDETAFEHIELKEGHVNVGLPNYRSNDVPGHCLYDMEWQGILYAKRTWDGIPLSKDALNSSQ